jgi:hypothetical protein
MTTKARRLTRQRGLITLIVLAALTVIVHSTAFSGASFTFVTNNPGATVTAGTYWFQTDKNGGAIITTPRLRPGFPETGTMTVTGRGDLDATYTLTKTIVSDPSSLASALNLKVEDITTPASPVTRYDGTIANLGTTNLGTITAGNSRTFRFTLTFVAAQALPTQQGAAFTAALHTTGVAQ